MSPLLSTLVPTHVSFKGSGQGGREWEFMDEVSAFFETLDLKLGKSPDPGLGNSGMQWVWRETWILVV